MASQKLGMRQGDARARLHVHVYRSAVRRVVEGTFMPPSCVDGGDVAVEGGVMASMIDASEATCSDDER